LCHLEDYLTKLAHPSFFLPFSNTVAHLNEIVVKEGCTESVKALLKDALGELTPTVIPLALQSIDTAPVGQLAACIQEAGL